MIAQLAGDGGLDAPTIFAAMQEPSIKDALKAATGQAVARGVFGTPTFFVRERMYFGRD